MKSRKLLTLMSLVMLGLVSFNCYAVINAGFQNQTTRDISLRGSFKGLSISSNFKASYELNPSTPTATLFGPDDLVEKVIYNIDSEGNLSFSFPKDFKIDGERNWTISIIVNGPALESYSASANGKITVLTPVDCKQLKVKTSSNGEIKFNQKVSVTGNTKIDGSSNGEVDFERGLNCNGKTDIDLSSNASLEIETFTATDVEVKLSSAAGLEIENFKGGNISVDCNSSAKAEISGVAEKGSFTATSSSKIDISKLSLKTDAEITTNSEGQIVR